MPTEPTTARDALLIQLGRADEQLKRIDAVQIDMGNGLSIVDLKRNLQKVQRLAKSSVSQLRKVVGCKGDAALLKPMVELLDEIEEVRVAHQVLKSESDAQIRDLTARLDAICRLNDRTPDDLNGPYDVGWDTGYNAALAKVRTIAKESR